MDPYLKKVNYGKSNRPAILLNERGEEGAHIFLSLYKHLTKNAITKLPEMEGKDEDSIAFIAFEGRDSKLIELEMNLQGIWVSFDVANERNDFFDYLKTRPYDIFGPNYE